MDNNTANEINATMLAEYLFALPPGIRNKTSRLTREETMELIRVARGLESAVTTLPPVMMDIAPELEMVSDHGGDMEVDEEELANITTIPNWDSWASGLHLHRPRAVEGTLYQESQELHLDFSMDGFLTEFLPMALMNHADMLSEFLFINIKTEYPHVSSLFRDSSGTMLKLNHVPLMNFIQDNVENLRYPNVAGEDFLECVQSMVFVSRVATIWELGVEEDEDYLKSIGLTCQLNYKYRLSKVLNLLNKAFKEGDQRRSIVLMCAFGHFMFSPSYDENDGLERNMPKLINQYRAALGKHVVCAPEQYVYHDDIIWDSMLLACSFSPKRGLRRLLSEHNEVSLPIMRFSRLSEPVKRHWLRLGLTLRHVYVKLDHILESDGEHDFYEDVATDEEVAEQRDDEVAVSEAGGSVEDDGSDLSQEI